MKARNLKWTGNHSQEKYNQRRQAHQTLAQLATGVDILPAAAAIINYG
jgi:hypothetical protein